MAQCIWIGRTSIEIPIGHIVYKIPLPMGKRTAPTTIRTSDLRLNAPNRILPTRLPRPDLIFFDQIIVHIKIICLLSIRYSVKVRIVSPGKKDDISFKDFSWHHVSINRPANCAYCFKEQRRCFHNMFLI